MNELHPHRLRKGVYNLYAYPEGPTSRVDAGTIIRGKNGKWYWTISNKATGAALTRNKAFQHAQHAFNS